MKPVLFQSAGSGIKARMPPRDGRARSKLRSPPSTGQQPRKPCNTCSSFAEPKPSIHTHSQQPYLTIPLPPSIARSTRDLPPTRVQPKPLRSTPKSSARLQISTHQAQQHHFPQTRGSCATSPTLIVIHALPHPPAGFTVATSIIASRIYSGTGGTEIARCQNA